MGVEPDLVIQQPAKRLGEESQVLEHTEDAHVEHDVQHVDGLAYTRLHAGTPHQPACRVAADGCQEDERQEAPVPAGIEEVAGKNDKKILPACFPPCQPIDGKDDREEQQEGIGIEQHVASVTRVRVRGSS